MWQTTLHNLLDQGQKNPAISLPELMNKQNSLIMGMLWQKEFPFQAFHSTLPKTDEDPKNIYKHILTLPLNGWTILQRRTWNGRFAYRNLWLMVSTSPINATAIETLVGMWGFTLQVGSTFHSCAMFYLKCHIITFCAVVLDLSVEGFCFLSILLACL